MSKKRKNHQRREKPKMCDPGMCDSCQYIGDGDFICDEVIADPESCLVVEGWEPTENYLRCRRKGRRHE